MSFSFAYQIRLIPNFHWIVLYAIFVILTQSAQAQTEVGGEVSGVWDIEGSPYILLENTIVPVNEELIIEPGVEVLLDSCVYFTINGRLLAEGTEEDSIYIMSRWEEPERKGYRISFSDADVNSILLYASIQNLLRGLGIFTSSPTISHCLVTECGDEHYNAVYVSGGNPILINFFLIENNYGIGIESSHGSAIIENNIIRDNARRGIRMDNGIIRNNIITGNTASQFGGGGIKARYRDVIISDNIISGNFADYGGGVYITSQRCILRNNIITDNDCETHGGGISTDRASIICSGNEIVGNRAGSGGGIYFGRYTENAHFNNNTVFGNQAEWTGGGIAGSRTGLTNIQNCIIWGNESRGNPQIGEFGGIREYSVVQGGWDGEGIIEDDPQFLDPDEGDFRLSEESPCIDAGNPCQLYNDSDGSRADIGHLGGNDLFFGYNADVIFLPAAPTCRLKIPFVLFNAGDEAFRMTSELENLDHFTTDVPEDYELLPNEWNDFTLIFNPIEFGEHNTDLILSFEDYDPVEEASVSLHGDAINEYRGDINGVWIQDHSPVHVVDTLAIPVGNNLLIEPGVEVQLDPECYITVRGTLRAIGAVEDSIMFTSSLDDPEPGSWKWIDARRGLTNVEYCTFEYGRLGYYLGVGFIRNSTISFFSEGGLIFGHIHGPRQVVSHCRISDCGMGVLTIDSGTLEYSVVNRCEVGLLNYTWLNAFRCIFAHNDTIDFFSPLEEHGGEGRFYGNIFYENNLMRTGEGWIDFDYNCVFDSPIEGERLFGNINRENRNGTACDFRYNITQNPLFVNPEEDDFNLREDSPCIDAGSYMWDPDPDRTIADIGAYYRESEGDIIQQLAVGEGWSIISLNISPNEFYYNQEEERGPDIVRMFRLNREELILLKDNEGRFYSPANDHFNNIPFWNLVEGYMIKMEEAETLQWFGEQIPVDTDIPLERDWNMIAYYPTYELEASAPDYFVLSPIIDQVEIAKDVYGNFLLPQFDFSNMPPWREGQGYQVMVGEDVVLNYPAEQEELAFTPPYPTLETWGGEQGVTPTDENMSVLITGITGIDVSIGDQIGAFSTDGLLVGNGSVELDDRCGIAVWGDDLSTEVKDGLADEETFTLRLWNSNSVFDTELIEGEIQKGDGLVYVPDGYIVLDVAVDQVIPRAFYLSQVYPNPFNAITKISFGLPESAGISIRVLDISGRLVATIADGDFNAGIHEIAMDASALSSGIYFVNLETGDMTRSIKVVLVR